MKSILLIVLAVFVMLSLVGCTANYQEVYSTETTPSVRPNPKTTSHPTDHKAISDSQESEVANLTYSQLTLEQCLDIAVKNNPDIAQKHWDTKTALAEKDIAKGALWPTIHAKGGYEHYRDDRLIKPRRPGDRSVLQFADDLISGDIVLIMPLYTGGRLQNQVKAAELLAKSTQQRLAPKQASFFRVPYFPVAKFIRAHPFRSSRPAG